MKSKNYRYGLGNRFKGQGTTGAQLRILCIAIGSRVMARHANHTAGSQLRKDGKSKAGSR